MGQKGKLLKIPAIAGLAVSMLLHRFFMYLCGGFKRFICTAFILLCFMVGNSFAYPVFGTNGFVSTEGSQEPVMAANTSDITLAPEEAVTVAREELLEDEGVLDGYEDAELHGMDQADKYVLDEILSEEEEQQTEEEAEPEPAAEKELSFSAEDWRLVLINKQHPIPDDYEITLGKIMTIKGEMQCDERIIEELLAMMQAASQEGVQLAICSPYRDLNRQEVLFNRKIKAYMNKGMSYMDAYALSSQAVTVPGASEHQIGLAIDIVSNTYTNLDEGFADTDAGKWLAEHSSEYGFILRYPKGKESITSIEFEPWHFRYVGKEAAEVIAREELCLEEFWDKYL